MSKSRLIRVGIDVGGTFTKAVSIDAETGDLLAKSAVPTTHDAEKGVASGIVRVLQNIIQESDTDSDSIEIISHSTTQAINALLESDVHKVGIIAMGVGPTKKDVVKRTRLDKSKTDFGVSLRVCHTFLDTSHLITEEEVNDAIGNLKGQGAEAIVATEAFGVDDPSNEQYVMELAAKAGMPSTASHEISGIYGLEIRTLTSVINASVLPKMLQVTNFVEETIRDMGAKAPLMIMKGDGGVTSMNTFRTKPILTVLSGPAASVAGALLYMRVTNGIFVEVGGTSTNVCVIKNGRPMFRYVTIQNHPTCIRSMDVRVVGVAGGSMIKLKQGKISDIGPRSAHIAGLTYSCFADPDDLRDGQIVMVRPKEGDDKYVCIRGGKRTYAVTNTCAANALKMVDNDDYAFADTESAMISMKKLGEYVGVSAFEAAQAVIQNASFVVTKTITKILKDYEMSPNTEIIGGGGGASVLVPFVAKQMMSPYRKADQAEVISSIGVASAMIQEEAEVSLVNPTSEIISAEHQRVQDTLISKGAIPESVIVNSEFIPDKAILRISGVGNVRLDGGAATKNVFTYEESRRRAAEIMGTDQNQIRTIFKSNHYYIFGVSITEKRLFIKRHRHRILVLDVFGRQKISLKNGKVFSGDGNNIIKSMSEFFKGTRSDIMPEVYVVNSAKAIDFSGLTSKSHIISAVSDELADGRQGIVLLELA